MNPCDPILFQQLPVIQKIIQDETWLEGERRGCRVGSDDRVVRERVCEVVLRVGQQLRESLAPSFAHPPSFGQDAQSREVRNGGESDFNR